MTNKVKKILIIGIIAVVVIALTVTGVIIFSNKPIYSINETMELSSGENSAAADMDLVCDFYASDLKKTTKYSSSIAHLALFACVDSHNSALVKIKGTEASDEKDNTQFLTSLGFLNVKEIESSAKTTEDEIDKAQIVIGYFSKKGLHACNLVMVVLRGTEGTDEWVNNFDYGADSSEYYNLTGMHSEWINKENHKGFDVTANRIVTSVVNYLSENNLNDSKTCVCVTGYSRGAALANIVASIFDDGSDSYKFNVTAYTFATPATTCSNDAKDEKYNNIFNIINEDDLIPTLPPSKLGFVRYGIDRTLSIGKNEEFLKKFEEISGTEYEAKDGFSTAVDTLNSIVSTREDTYKIIDTEDVRIKISKSKLDDAQKEKEKLITELNTLGVYDLCYISEITQNEDKYEFYYVYSTYFIMKLIPTILDMVENEDYLSLLSYMSYLNCSKYSNLLSSVGLSILGNGVLHGHYPTSYSIIVDNLK